MRVLSTLLLFLLACENASSEDTSFQAGFAKVDVTPTAPLRLSGYGNRDHPSEGIDTRLYLRAMALKATDGETFVLISFDSIGVPASFTDDVAARLEKEVGIARKRFVLATTHSHTTPHLTGGLTNIFAVPLSESEENAAEAYTAVVKDNVVQVVRNAIADLKPATLSVGKGEAGFAMNRRVVKDGVYQGFGVTPQGAVDHTVSVLKVTSPDGMLRGIVFNYACHATTLEGSYYQVNGDWPGYAASDLEEMHSGLVALSTIGAGADANPEPRGGPQAKDHAQAHGRALALAVSAVVKKDLTSVDAAPVASFGFAGLQFDRPGKPELEERLKSKTPQQARHAKNMLETLERMGRLPESYPMPVQTWQFGDELTMVFLGGEVVVDYAHRLKREIEPGFVWVTAYANDVFGYVASERLRSEGGYEVDGSMIYYNLPGRWSQGTEELLIKRVHEILETPQGEEALSPQEAKQSFRLPQGFEIDLVASEPLIADPVNFSFGPDGRLWVAQMGDYPRGGDGRGAPAGKIVVLSDDDQDGKFDTSTVFLERLSYPNGVMPWRDGALISCAPDIFFAKDTDGDGKADTREVLLTGFPESNPQHRVNGFAFGLDGLVHIAHGASGISSPKTGQQFDFSGRDIALNPDTGEAFPMSGDSQFGRCRTDFGDWFGNANSRPLFQYVLDEHYLKRNPHVRFPDPKRQLITGGEMQVHPASRTVDRFNDPWAANRFTSACGPTIFRDRSLGSELHHAGFTCEPVHNLVRCVQLASEGTTFHASRLPAGDAEFIASSDPWCRPVRAATGPDGALWIADMYRLVIEHPEWIPEAWQARLDLRAGSDKGRIWRVRRSDATPQPLVDLTSLATAELVELLEHDNGTVRDLVQQLLIWRNDESAIPRLEEIATTLAKPAARVQALATLLATGQLDLPTIESALHDQDPQVVRFAVRASESLLNSHPPLGEKLVALAIHADARVRQQIAYSLGEWNNPRAAEGLARLAVKSTNDPLLRSAVLSSATKYADRILAEVVLEEAVAANIAADLVATALGADSANGPRKILDALSTIDSPVVPEWQLAAVASIAHSVKPEFQRSISEHPTIRRSLEAARETITANDASLGLQRASVRVLAGPSGTTQDRTQLALALTPRTPLELQLEIIDALSRSGQREIPELLLAGWTGHGPQIRKSILETLLSRPEWRPSLWQSIASGILTANDFDASARDRLVNSEDATTRSKAAMLFAESSPGSRSEVLAKFEDAQSLSGDPGQGRILFEKSCAGCHKLGSLGNEFGPNLALLTDKSSSALLTSILDPNRAVEAKYRGYTIVTSDGRVLSGLIVRESSGSITIAAADGRTTELLRKEIDEIRDTGKSFMPEGLERDLTPQALADMMAFVREAKE